MAGLQNFGLQGQVADLQKTTKPQGAEARREESARKLRERTEQLTKFVDECNVGLMYPGARYPGRRCFSG